MDDSVGNPTGSGGSWRERRSVPRYSLIAVAETIEPISGMHFSGRISEMSLKGCYVDVLNPLPVSTVIDLKVTRDQGTFATRGRVIYSQQGMGMGVAFLDTASDQVKILEGWLADLAAA